MSRTVQHRSDHGYTLTELLVVMLILGLLAAAIAPRVIGRLDSSKLKAAALQLDTVSSAVDVFFIDTGRYPTEEEGLAALLTAPENLTSWDGPYLRSRNNLTDPWGTSIKYSLDGANGPTLTSFGADQSEGGEGDAADLYYPDVSRDG